MSSRQGPSRPTAVLPLPLLVLLLILLLASSSTAAELLPPKYKFGDPVPVSCVARNIETGEHLTDAEGRIEYVPFPTCLETRKPLQLYFGVEKEVNCTVEIDDHFFHLLEFYVHNDAPMTCRIPSRPISLLDPASADSPANQVGVLGTEDSRYVPLVVALSGILQYSHLHVSNNLNILMHAAPKRTSPGVIDAATAYSISHLSRNAEIIIGDSLPLRFSVRWYPSSTLPSGWTGMGGHLYLSTVLYCFLSAGAATALCVAYYRGIVLPKRLKSWGNERTFSTERGRYNSGYGVGIGINGYGYSGGAPASGKID